MAITVPPRLSGGRGLAATAGGARRAAAGFRRLSYVAVVVLGAVAAVCIIAFDSPRAKMAAASSSSLSAAGGGDGQRMLQAAVRRATPSPREEEEDAAAASRRVVLRGRSADRRQGASGHPTAVPPAPSKRPAKATFVAGAEGDSADAEATGTAAPPPTTGSGGGGDGGIPPAMSAERRLLRRMVADNRTVGRSVVVWPSAAVSKAVGRRTAKSRPAGSSWPSQPNVAVLSLHVGADEATRNDDPSAKASWLHQLSLRNKARYCARWGYDLIIEKAPPGIGGAKTPREVSWAKIPLLLRYMNLTAPKSKKAPRYDWIFWADMDALFTNPKLPLVERLTTLVDGAHHAPDLVVAQDWHGINLGTFLVRNNPATRALLEAIWLTTKADWDPFAEQSALIRTLQAAGAGHPADNLKTKTGPRGTVVRMAGGRNAHTLDKTVKAPYAQHAAVTADLSLLPQMQWIEPASLAPASASPKPAGDGELDSDGGDGGETDARPAAVDADGVAIVAAAAASSSSRRHHVVRVQYRQPRELNAYPEAFAYGYVSSMWKDGDLVAHFPNCKGIRTCRGTVERIARLADRRYEALAEDEDDGGAGALAARVADGAPRWVVPEGAFPAPVPRNDEDEDEEKGGSASDQEASHH